MDSVTLIVTPLECKPNKCNKYQDTYIELDCLPVKNVNMLEIIAYHDGVNPNGKSVTVRLVEFVVGFVSGWLVRCLYRNPVGGKRELTVLGRFNRKPNYKESLFMRMSNVVFAS